MNIQKEWGTYERLLESDQYRVNRFVVLPNTKTAPKFGTKRRHWIVLSGNGSMQYTNAFGYRYGEPLESNDHVTIPSGALYFVTNHSVEPLIIIELQLAEDQTINE